MRCFSWRESGQLKTKKLLRLRKMNRVCNLFRRSQLAWYSVRSALSRIYTREQDGVGSEGERPSLRWAASQCHQHVHHAWFLGSVRGVLLNSELITCRIALQRCAVLQIFLQLLLTLICIHRGHAIWSRGSWMPERGHPGLEGRPCTSRQ